MTLPRGDGAGPDPFPGPLAPAHATLIQAPTSCEGSNSLLWFNPGTRAEQWLIRAPANVTGVAVAIPFYSQQNGNL